VRAHVRTQLEANARKPYSPITHGPGRPFKYREFTEEEGTALLARIDPDWRLHLNDGRVIDRILERLP
jgi:hypothetical protein